MSDTAQIFDRTLKAKQRKHASGELFLRDLSNQHLADILAEDIAKPLELATILEPNAPLEALLQHRITTTQNPVEDLIDVDDHVNLDGSYDLITSSLQLHWVNDLPGVLIQLRNHLNDAGLLLVTLLGGNTLYELRNSVHTAETELRGGISPRISPSVDVKDAGRLLQRAGYHLPVASSHHVTVTYPNATALMRELKQMGEQNALLKRPRGLMSTQLLQHINDIYMRDFSDNNKIKATFEIITLTAWKN